MDPSGCLRWCMLCLALPLRTSSSVGRSPEDNRVSPAGTYILVCQYLACLAAGCTQPHVFARTTVLFFRVVHILRVGWDGIVRIVPRTMMQMTRATIRVYQVCSSVWLKYFLDDRDP